MKTKLILLAFIVATGCIFAQQNASEKAADRANAARFTVITFRWQTRPDGKVDSIFTTDELNKVAIGSEIYGAETIPGNPAPSDEYSVELLDLAGVDVFGGALHARSATLPEIAKPKIGAWLFTDLLSLKVSGNFAKNAQGTVKVFLLRGN